MIGTAGGVETAPSCVVGHRLARPGLSYCSGAQWISANQNCRQATPPPIAMPCLLAPDGSPRAGPEGFAVSAQRRAHGWVKHGRNVLGTGENRQEAHGGVTVV